MWYCTGNVKDADGSRRHQIRFSACVVYCRRRHAGLDIGNSTGGDTDHPNNNVVLVKQRDDDEVFADGAMAQYNDALVADSRRRDVAVACANERRLAALLLALNDFQELQESE